MGTNAVRQNDLSVQPLPTIASEAVKTQNQNLLVTGHFPNNDKQLEVKKGHTPFTKESFQQAIRDSTRQAVNKFMTELTKVIAREMQRANNGEQRVVTQLEAKFDAMTQQVKDLAKQIGELKTDKARLENENAELRQKQDHTKSNEIVSSGEKLMQPPPIPPRPQRANAKPVEAASAGEVDKNAAPASSKADPKEFPKNGTAKQKLEFVKNLLNNNNNNNNVSLADIEKQINPKHEKNDKNYKPFVKLAGGGHGNVLLILGTPHVIKTKIQGSEKRTLNFLYDLKALKDKVGNKKVSASEVEAIRAGMVSENEKVFSKEMMKSSPESLARSLNNYEHIDATFSVPTDIEGDYAVFPNANPNLADDELNSEGSILDIKNGYDIVSRHELALNEAESKTTGFAWLRKKIVARLIPYLKGTNERGFEVVSDEGRYLPKIPLIGKFLQRFINGRNSVAIINSKLSGINEEQRSELKRLANSARIAQESLPFSMTGASTMIHVPDNNPKIEGDAPPKKTGQVGLKFGDFAHVIFEHDVDKMNAKKGKDGLPGNGVGIREDKFIYLKNNSTSGFNNVSKLF